MNKVQEKNTYKLGYRAGVKAVARWMHDWDAQIDHPCRIDDVIMCKFNLTRRRYPRKKKQ